MCTLQPTLDNLPGVQNGSPHFFSTYFSEPRGSQPYLWSGASFLLYFSLVLSSRSKNWSAYFQTSSICEWNSTFTLSHFFWGGRTFKNYFRINSMWRHSQVSSGGCHWLPEFTSQNVSSQVWPNSIPQKPDARADKISCDVPLVEVCCDWRRRQILFQGTHPESDWRFLSGRQRLLINPTESKAQRQLLNSHRIVKDKMLETVCVPSNPQWEWCPLALNSFCRKLLCDPYPLYFYPVFAHDNRCRKIGNWNWRSTSQTSVSIDAINLVWTGLSR